MMLKNRNLLFVILSLCYGESNSYTNATIDNAIEKYSELANDNPNNKEIDYNLGNLNYYKGELDRAISHYNGQPSTWEKVLPIYPTSPVDNLI